MLQMVTGVLFGRLLRERLERRFPRYRRFNEAMRGYGFWIATTLILILVVTVIVWSAVAA